MITFDNFLNWAESRFGGDVVIKGNEIMVNSIFVPDYKHHLSCNPSKALHGVYHCWKSDKGGSLVDLVMRVDKCSYEEAMEKLGLGFVSIRDLENKLNDIFSKKSNQETTEESLPKSDIKLPSGTFWIKSLPSDNAWRIEAEKYLSERKINSSELLVCIDDDEYKNRIIIPYYNEEGKIIYWNGRTLSNSEAIPKYRGPDKEKYGIGKGDVVYFSDGVPPAGSKIYITEGEFDAKTLSYCGFFSAALGGKLIEIKQIEKLRGLIPVICFDTDDKLVDAGGEALVKVGEEFIKKGFNEIYYVRPPKIYKDWNKMFVVTNSKIINAYIKQHEKRFSNSTSIEMKLKNI